MLDDLYSEARHDGDVPIEHAVDGSDDVFEGGELDELQVGEDDEEEVGLGELDGVDDLFEGEAALDEDEDLRGLGVAVLAEIRLKILVELDDVERHELFESLREDS